MPNVTKTQDYRPFRVLAKDPEDLAVVSAMLQDAVVPVVDLAYLKDEAQLVFVGSRYAWEGQPEKAKPAKGSQGIRVRCAVTFSEVKRVQVKNLDLTKTEQMLSLLAIAYGAATEEEPDLPTEARLLFSGGAEIRVELASLSVQAEDFGDPWPTLYKPGHDAAD